MAQLFFEKLPKIEYQIGDISFPDFNIGQDVLSTKKPLPLTVSFRNIFIRTKIRDVLFTDKTVFYNYTWRDQDRPDTIARLYYGHERYFWLVFYSNDAFDFTMDFPLTQDGFNSYLFDKYSSNTTLFPSGVSDSAYLINQLMREDDNFVRHYEVNGLIVDKSIFDAAATTNKRRVSYYTYEFENNENKRTIRLVSRVHLTRIERELDNILKGL